MNGERDGVTMVRASVGPYLWRRVYYAIFMIHHPIRCLALCAALAGFPGPMVTAQESERGSRFVESGHWAYEYLARLRTRGYLGELDPLVHPHHREDIVRALSTLDPDTLPRPVAHSVYMKNTHLKYT